MRVNTTSMFSVEYSLFDVLTNDLLNLAKNFYFNKGTGGQI